MDRGTDSLLSMTALPRMRPRHSLVRNPPHPLSSSARWQDMSDEATEHPERQNAAASAPACRPRCGKRRSRLILITTNHTRIDHHPRDRRSRTTEHPPLAPSQLCWRAVHASIGDAYRPVDFLGGA